MQIVSIKYDPDREYKIVEVECKTLAEAEEAKKKLVASDGTINVKGVYHNKRLIDNKLEETYMIQFWVKNNG